jgi:hypothetical protein
LLRYARNDVKTHFLSLRGAQRRSNLDFFNSPTITGFLKDLGGISECENLQKEKNIEDSGM